MGKAKQVMRSLRSRFSSMKGKATAPCPAPSASTASSYPSLSSACFDDRSASKFRTSPSSTSTHAPQTTQSETPRTTHQIGIVLDAPVTTREAEDIHGQGKITAILPPVSGHAELAASRAILDSARKLPLGKLSMVENGLEHCKDTCSDIQGPSEGPSSLGYIEHQSQASTREQVSSAGAGRSLSTSDVSRDSFSWRPLQPNEGKGCVEELGSSFTKLRGSRSPALSLSSKSSTSTRSFACRSARRIERKHETAEDAQDDVSCFGSLSGWGIGGGRTSAGPAMLSRFSIECGTVHTARTLDPLAKEDKPAFIISNVEFNALPDWSDVEDDPEHNVHFEQDSDIWSVSSMASSNNVAPGIDKKRCGE